ncbi:MULTISPECIES: DUF6683 family protein [Asticcacaulis]|uniref:DUF6683 family protein n=1 Tax=Asticcacaulis TaxID=76890 RepID=UPI001AE8D7F9|nr:MULTISPECIES: DUF6683 family protein [Asticcacaulis]MBP2157788.1 hypothetical protein [Asticcacaulis solisilvae]MDR6798833.1 hypothetical protein [Asticcacaulis sp. BE141]
MPRSFLRILSLALSLCLPLTGTARAQDLNMYSVIPHDYVMNDILNRQRIEAAISQPLDGPSKRTVPVPKAAPPQASSSGPTTYARSPEISRKVEAEFVAQIRERAGHEPAAQIDSILKSNDAVASWASIMADDGLRPGDITDAFAGYWVLNWAMANGTDSTKVQTLAVRDQVRPIMAVYGGLSDARKQELAETFMLNTLLQHAAYVDAMKRGDTATLRKLGDAAEARFRADMGIGLRNLKLTTKGFVPA